MTRCTAIRLKPYDGTTKIAVVHPDEWFQDQIQNYCVRSEHSDKHHIDGSKYPVETWEG